MSQSFTIRAVARMVARQPMSLQQSNHLSPERRSYTATRPIATSTSGPVAKIRHKYSGPQCFYSTSAAPPGGVQPPDHLDDKERHIFDKLVAQLEPSRLEVRFCL